MTYPNQSSDPYGYGDYTQSTGAYGDPYASDPAYLAGQKLPGDTMPAVLAHLSVLIAVVLSAGWLAFVGPLVLWAITKDNNPLARQAAAGAFNFSITATIAIIVGWVFFFTIIGIPVALLLWLAVAIIAIWCHVRGAIAAGNNDAYNYPLQIKVLR